MTTVGAVYKDRYVRQDDRWLIDRRIGDFLWQQESEIHSS